MFYVINDWLKFIPEHKTISTIDNEDVSVTLSNQASRLLMEFIKNGDETLSKEFLLKNVWEAFGLTPSSNNLYSALSELRKSFMLLGENGKMILTVPKVGFQFIATITHGNNETFGPITTNQENDHKQIKDKTTSYVLSCVGIIALTLLIMNFHKTNRSQPAIHEWRARLVKDVDKCKIYSINEQLKQISNETIKDIMKHTNLSSKCTSEAFDIYYYGTERIYGHGFIASCRISKDNIHLQCSNIKVI